MRCANITENTPFAEVSKLINDLWQQYCLAAEPKGVDHQVHHSNPVVSQNTKIVKDNATEGGAHEKLRKLPAAYEVLDTEEGTYLTRSEEAARNTGFEYNGLYRRESAESRQDAVTAHEKGLKAARDAFGELAGIEITFPDEATLDDLEMSRYEGLEAAILSYIDARGAAITAKHTDGREGE